MTKTEPRSVAYVGTKYYPVKIGDKTHIGHCSIWLLSDGTTVEYKQPLCFCGSKKWGGRNPVKIAQGGRFRLTCTKCNPEQIEVDFDAMNAEEELRMKERIAGVKARNPDIFGI